VNPEVIEREFRDKVCQKLRLHPEGLDRYRVFTPFQFEDGDHLAILFKREGNTWTLSDEGHTYMHLSYELDERDLHKGTREKIITNALSVFAVEDREGELVLPVAGERYGDALYNFIQALLKITDVSYLSRERVRSTFLEDFRTLMQETVPEGRRAFDWHDRARDPDAKYPVDCRVNSIARPLFVFAVPSDDKARDTTISLHQFERWSLPFRSLAVFEDQEAINRRVLARLSDVGEKLFSSLATNRDRIVQYVRECMSG
jgi:hypothetical protein